MKTNCLALLLVLAVLFPRAIPSHRALGEEEKTKPCFECKGKGEGRCAREGCREGWLDCPGPCVKASGKWVKRPTPGHDPDELWQWVKFIPRGSGYVSQGHTGQYFTVDAARKVTPHTCETCKGNSSLPCPACNGKGRAVCFVCAGKKSVPESWSAFDHPRMKDRPLRFKLKDGRTVVARKRKVVDTTVTLQTEKGVIEVEKQEILSEEKQPPQP